MRDVGQPSCFATHPSNPCPPMNAPQPLAPATPTTPAHPGHTLISVPVSALGTVQQILSVHPLSGGASGSHIVSASPQEIASDAPVPVHGPHAHPPPAHPPPTHPPPTLQPPAPEPPYSPVVATVQLVVDPATSARPASVSSHGEQGGRVPTPPRGTARVTRSYPVLPEAVHRPPPRPIFPPSGGDLHNRRSTAHYQDSVTAGRDDINDPVRSFNTTCVPWLTLLLFVMLRLTTSTAKELFPSDYLTRLKPARNINKKPRREVRS